VLTFDDGWGDFRANAFPIVQRYGFPATVYLTSYYCLFNKPVVPVVVEYLLWKCRGEVFENSDLPFLPRKIDLRSEENRRATLLQLDGYAKRRALSGKERDDLVAEIADLLQIDYESLLYERRFHIMKPEEVTEISRGGIDVQLHTHSHRILLNRDEFVEDIKQNQRHVEELTGKDGRVHFCYPGGIHRPEFLPWLGEAGIQSATTCVPAFSRKTGNSLLLPRLLDRPSLSEIEFEGWVAGFGVTMPRLKLPPRDVASPPQVTTVRG
jgi:peptidoglycan/xylan/chitin deacetylase (PgdA/CDA1 family)